MVRYGSTGWCASEYLAGAHEPGRWSETIAVGDRFHRALDPIPKPRFLDDRSSAWAVGDRVAWGEISAAESLEARTFARWPPRSGRWRLPARSFMATSAATFCST